MSVSVTLPGGDTLLQRMEAVNRKYFQYGVLPGVGWSRGRIQKRYRRITFGCYDIRKKQIRLHPVLKDPRVPAFVTDFVIYHELLHYGDYAVHKTASPVRSRLKVNRVHTPEFHSREKEFNGKKEASVLMRKIASGDWDFSGVSIPGGADSPTISCKNNAMKDPDKRKMPEKGPVWSEFLPFFRS